MTGLVILLVDFWLGRWDMSKGRGMGGCFVFRELMGQGQGKGEEGRRWCWRGLLVRMGWAGVRMGRPCVSGLLFNGTGDTDRAGISRIVGYRK